MAVSVSCDSCEYKFLVDSEHRGKRIRCPSCGDPVLVGGVAGPPAKAPSSRTARRRHRVQREAAGGSKLVIGAGIAASLLAVAVAGFFMMSSGTQNSEVVESIDERGVQKDASGVPEIPGPGGGEFVPTVRNSSERPKLQNAARSGAGEDPGREIKHSGPTTDNEGAQIGAPPSDFQFTTWEAFNDHVQPSVVRIDVKMSSGTNQGSGFVVDSGGVIATNYHVIGGADRITVTFKNGDEFRVKGYVHLDSNKDIAMLKIDPGSSLEPLKALPLLEGEPRTGAEVAAFGAPHGFDFTFSPGNISGYRTSGEMRSPVSSAREGHWVQHTAAISKGSSGGPLVSRDAEVVAMNTLYVTEAQNLNFGISSDDIRQALTSQTAVLPVSPVTAPDLRSEPTIDGEPFGMAGIEVIDSVGTVKARELLGQLKALGVDGRKKGSVDARNVIEGTVLATARKQLRDCGIESSNGDSRLRIFMTLHPQGPANSLELTAMIFVSAGDRTVRRIWQQSDEVGGVSQRMLSRGELPGVLKGNIETFFKKMRRSITSAQRDAASSE